jgi:hypothetical protein
MDRLGAELARALDDADRIAARDEETDPRIRRESAEAREHRVVER